MNNRTLTITALVAIVVIVLGYLSFTTPGSPLYPGTSGNSSSASSDASSVRSTASSAVSSDDDSSSSVVSSSRSSASSRSTASSASSVTSGTGSSSSFAQTTPRETVSHFYLQAASYNGDVIADIAKNSTFLTPGFAASLGNDNELFCNDRQPLNFSTVLVSRTDTDATVQVNEKYMAGTVGVLVSVQNDNGVWRIDGVTCDTSSSSTSSL